MTRRAPRGSTVGSLPQPWSTEPGALYEALGSSPAGLAAAAAARRLRTHGKNQIRAHTRITPLRTLWDQVRSPLLLLLVAATGVSLTVGQWVDATIVLAIVVATVGVGFARERRAETALAALRTRLRAHTVALRDGRPTSIALEHVVPGDVVMLAAGSLVPADAVLVDATDFFVSEAALTGESFPVAKQVGASAPSTPLAQRTGCVFLGTNVRSGTARCLVVATGMDTQYGAIARRLTHRAPDTEFDRGIRRLGYVLTSAMLTMTLVVFVIHVLMGRPPVETLLFAIALAVGLSPELLPAILSVNLSRSASAMAHTGVLVRRLDAIENLGSMDVLCTDKTGTLTAGVVGLDGAHAPDGSASSDVLELAAVNAALQTGLPSPLDDAILRAHGPLSDRPRKRGEIPFDFVRKRVSVVVERPEGIRLISKGAFGPVLDACASLPSGAPLDAEVRAALERRHAEWGSRGLRVLAVAWRSVPDQPEYTRHDEVDLTLAGFTTFLDPPKEGAREAIAGLTELGVTVKMITGDAKLVAEHVAARVGLHADATLTGRELDELHDEALWREAERTSLFVEVDPNQKERIIRALQKTRHVVGFLGDGVNDVPAMHRADVSLSVDQAVDVAQAAADVVLLDRHLDVIRRGITEGRVTFANTLKYVLITTSANLGNMVSMALVSLYLPFLPLLAGQILLNNFLSDIPALGIANDRVDPEMTARPRRWDARFIARFMVEFGLLSSLFDALTFALLLTALD